MGFTITDRGFELIEFADDYGKECSLQQSSAIGDHDDSVDRPGTSFVWLGIKGTRMHLGRELAQELSTVLAHWVKTGSLDTRPALERLAGERKS